MDPPTGPPMGPYDYDLVVIGGGSGGVAVAKEAAALVKKVLVLDLVAPSPRGAVRELGGSSINSIRIRRFLQQASLLGKAVQDSKAYGWGMKEHVSHGWSELVAAVQEKVKTRSSELKRELKSCGVYYLKARGEIVAPHTVEDLLSLTQPPGRTLVVGGSAEGLECAGFLFGLGLPVTIMPQPHLLPGFDRGMAEKIENHMIVNGVDFHYNCSLTKVELTEACSKEVVLGASATGPQQVPRGKLRVTITSKDGQTKQEEFDMVLLADGRKASTSDIGLECVGVQCNQDTGRILVNERDETSVDNIYAIGSVQHGRPSTTGLSVHSGTLLARRLYGDDDILERVVGLHVMGPNAGDILQGFVAAMKCGLTKQQLDATVGIHPGTAQVLSSLTETQRMTEALMIRGNC
ncbi:Thioredoxin reductase 1 [Nibea albiflora]|uniref:Thioredoxin reductase 1 n=1 Tax=Nibea albiflora TaxID=240163 RepID=A0ACB7EV32_NIBAL|nr:Thioredoxin reductase 1 [Nibea albiflora]